MSEEPRLPVKNNTSICQRRCRIPRRLPARHHLHNNFKSTSEYQNKGDSMYQSRNGLRYMARPSSAESHPKSANQAVEIMGDIAEIHDKSRCSRPVRDKLLPAQKKPVHRKKNNDTSTNEARKQIITVPVRQNFLPKPSSQNRSQLPNQETIKIFEDLEIKKDFYDSPSLHDEDELLTDFNDEENVSSKKDEVMQLKTLWQEKIVQFDRMKFELHDKQNVLLKIYAALQNTKEKLSTLGQGTNLPSIDNLRIMNVAHMTPNQLLQMCTENGLKIDSQQLTNYILTVDIKKINDIPTRLISTCERTLASRKEIIKCFENLENQEKGSSKSTFSKKINEFILENETLKSDLHNVKNMFLNDLSEFLRKCCDEILAFQQRNQTLTHELQKLRSQSTYFRKKVAALEQQRISANKFKFEELSKELKEEKSKSQMFKQRLIRAEGQLKIHDERATTYESALEQARTQTRNLERTIQQLNEQNRRMQNDFDDELNQLNDSMKKNTKNLEEIAHAREALQSEKDVLKIQLDEISNHYQEHVKNLKIELSQNTEKIIDNENKYKQEVEENQILRSKNLSQCEKLKELELRHENTSKQLEQTEVTLSEQMNETKKYKFMYEELRLGLDKNNHEINKYKVHLDELNATLTGLREDLQRAHEVEEKLRRDVTSKDNYITELENKQKSLHQKSNENEKKLETYEEQLLSLNNHITTLKEHFGQFENITDIHEMINQQNIQLNDMNCENNKLLNEIEKNQNKLEQLKKATEEQEHVILQNHNVLQMLSEKKDEHALSVKKFNKEINDKNDKIESVIATVEMKNHQISQLEKIILTLEESNSNFCIQRQKYHDRINLLENKINQYENLLANRNDQIPHDNLDKLIKILENEIDAPYDSQVIRCMEKDKKTHKICDTSHRMPKNTKLFFGTESNNTSQIVMSNFNKNTSASNYEEKHEGDSFDCKQVVPNIDTHEYPFLQKSGSQNTSSLSVGKDDFLQINEIHSAGKKQKQNLCYIVPNHAQEKRNKMYKLAGHRVL